jgi:hypothetical protein
LLLALFIRVSILDLSTSLRPAHLLSRWEKGKKGIGNGFWLLLRDPMTGILDVDSPDVGCDLSEEC